MCSVRRGIILGAAILVCTVLIYTYWPTETHNIPLQVSVVLEEKGFQPREITVKKGGTVTFSTVRNKPFWPASNLHPSHTIYSEFDPLRPLQPTETWQFTFDRLGDWAYHDHLRSYYVGTVHVVE